MTRVKFVVVDIETTGLAPPSEVIEIGWCHLFFDTETKSSEVFGPWSKLFRPTQPMTSDVLAVHHLTNAMLAEFEPCTEADLCEVVGDAQFVVAAMSAFEAQWITPPEGVRWICTVKAAARIYPDAPSAGNQAMRYELGLELDPAVAMPPHRAGPDAFVTAHILAEFLKTERVSHLAAWTLQPRWMPRCPLNKHKGKPWADVPSDYLVWVTTKATEMDPDTKHWAALELERRKPAPADETAQPAGAVA